MKKLLLIFLTAIAVSCSSDDNNSAEPNKDGLKLKSIEITHYTSDENGNKIVSTEKKAEYFYGSNGYANKVVTTDVFDSEVSVYYEYYEYSGNSLKQREYNYKGYYNEDTEINNFLYNNNLINKETITRNKHVSTVNYKYNSFKNLVNLESFDGKDKELRMSADFTYDNKGNVIKESVKTYFDDYSFTASYQYDNKNNPLKNVFPKAYLKTIQVGENNIIDANGQKTKYEYNDQGYPIKSIHPNRTSTYEYY